LNFAWGKALMDFFLGSLFVSGLVVPEIEVPAAILFFLAFISLITLSIAFRKEEKIRVDKDLEDLRNYKE
jgi:hypothetical protein